MQDHVQDKGLDNSIRSNHPSDNIPRMVARRDPLLQKQFPSPRPYAAAEPS